MTLDLYDAVLYPGYPFPQTHPDRLFTIATLHGLDAAPPEDCRVLEVGCGDGLNAVTMAAHLPGLRVLAIDRAAAPLARGRAIAAELGLENVELRALDVLEAGDLGTFDYVVAHGVYSWVPEPVRDGLLALASRSLAPAGVAFVSYNALPGCYVRHAARDLMRFHAGDAADVSERLARAREAIGFASRFPQRVDPYGQALEVELLRLSRVTGNALLHDELSDVWEPSYLAAVVDHARGHGLDYLADAELSELMTERLPEGVEDALREFGGEDLVRREQYADLLMGRPFRQTLLARADTPRSPEPVADLLGRLQLSSTRVPDPVGGGYASPVDAAVAVLADRHPRTATVEELAAATGAPLAELAAGLLAAFRGRLVDLHARPPDWAAEVPPRPAVSPLVRLMARDGTDLPTLTHSSHPATDPVTRRLVTLMDGSRDRAGLIQGLLDSVGSEIVVEDEDGGSVPARLLREPFAEQVDADLAELARVRLILRDGA